MSKNNDFIEKLTGYADDLHNRAPLAALRRGASGEGHDIAGVCPYVLPHVPYGASDARTQAYLDLACLFGLHPSKTAERQRGLTLAEALRSIAEKTGSGSIEQRFVALLQSHRDELLSHIRYAVALARSHEQHLAWDDILDALSWWDMPGSEASSRSPQRRWAKDFWGRRQNDDTQPANA